MSNSKTVYDQWEMLQREQRKQHQRFSPSARCRECELGLDLTHIKCLRCFYIRHPTRHRRICAATAESSSPCQDANARRTPVSETGTPWTPSYPGEKPPLELNESQIAALEAERRSLTDSILGGYTPPVKPAPIVVAKRQPESVVAPAEDLELKGRIARAHLRAAEIQKMFDEAVEQLKTRFTAEMTAAMNDIAQLEQKKTFEVDRESAQKLTAVIEEMRESGDEDRAIAARESAADQRVLQLRHRVVAVLKQAEEIRAALSEWDSLYADQLDRLRNTSRDSFLFGVPAGDAVAVQRAVSTYNAILRGLDDIATHRSSLTNMLDTSVPRVIDGIVEGGYIAEINRLVASAAQGSLTKEAERTLNFCVTRLGYANQDSVLHLQALTRGVLGAVRSLRAMKSGSSEPIEFSQKVIMSEPVSPGPSVAKDADWSPLAVAR